MSMRWVNRHGLLALPGIFIMNIIVTAFAVWLSQVEIIAAIVLAYGWMWYLSVQTRLMIVLIVLLGVGGAVITQFSPEITAYQVCLAVGFLSVITVVGHGLSLVVTTVTGY